MVRLCFTDSYHLFVSQLLQKDRSKRLGVGENDFVSSINVSFETSLLRIEGEAEDGGRVG